MSSVELQKGSAESAPRHQSDTAGPLDALPPIACAWSTRSFAPLLVKAAEAASATSLLPRVVLVLCMHHAAAVCELGRGTGGEWGEPHDRLLSNTTAESILYRSGMFALRGEARDYTWHSRAPFAFFHPISALLKTPATIGYLFALLLLAAARQPASRAARFLRLYDAVAAVADVLRAGCPNALTRRGAQLLEARATQRARVHAAFDQLLDKYRGAMASSRASGRSSQPRVEADGAAGKHATTAVLKSPTPHCAAGRAVSPHSRIDAHRAGPSEAPMPSCSV